MQVFPRSSLMGQGRESHAELLLFYSPQSVPSWIHPHGERPSHLPASLLFLAHIRKNIIPVHMTVCSAVPPKAGGHGQALGSHSGTQD